MARQVELQTSIGSFVVELYDNHAPKTCKNFRELARKGYYNETPVGHHAGHMAKLEGLAICISCKSVYHAWRSSLALVLVCHFADHDHTS